MKFIKILKNFKREISFKRYSIIFKLYRWQNKKRNPDFNKKIYKRIENNLIKILQHVYKKDELIWIGDIKNDGSYPIHKSYKKSKWAISPGIGESTIFERELVKNGISVTMLDLEKYRPKKLLKAYPEFCEFIPKFISSENSEDTISLKNLINEKNSNNGILQIDIEGAEWNLIRNTSIDIIKKASILIIEIHNFHELILPSQAEDKIKVLEKILNNYKVLWARRNTTSPLIKWRGFMIPDVIEISMIRSDIV